MEEICRTQHLKSELPNHPNPTQAPLSLGGQGREYRPKIDGLRALAVVAVIGYHYFPSFVPGGYLGVDIFFGISGYLITGILLNSDFTPRALARFFHHRVRRIAPALLVVVASCWLIGWQLLLPVAFSDFALSLIASLCFTANFLFQSQGDYFAAASITKPLLHLWSLGVEEQFYIVWPFFLWALLRRTGRVGRHLWLVVGCSAVLQLVDSFLGRTSAFFLPQDRAWELISGAALAFHERKFGAPGQSRKRMKLDLIALGAIITPIIFAEGEIGPSVLWEFPVLTGTGILLLTRNEGSLCTRLLENKMAVYLGRISYPVYLWHWPILCFASLYFVDLGVSGRFALCAAVMALSSLTYQFVERPARFVSQNEYGRKVLAALSLLIILSGLLIGIFTITAGGFQERFASLENRPHAPSSVEIRNSWRYRTCFLLALQTSADFSTDCVDGGLQQPLVLLWGDSHAAQLVPGLRALQKIQSFRIGQLTSEGCPPLMELVPRGRPHCQSINYSNLERVAQMRPSVVILAAYWSNYKLPDSQIPQLSETIEAIKKAGVKRIVLVGPVPRWSQSPEDIWLSIVRRSWTHQVPNQIRVGLDQDTENLDVELRAFARSHKIEFLSAYRALCSFTGCSIISLTQPTELLQFDTNHLTPVGSELVMSSFRVALENEEALGELAH